MRYSYYTLVSIAVAFVCLLFSCDDNSDYDDGREFDPNVIGSWISADGNESYTFDNNSLHTYIHTTDNLTVAEEGRWWTINGNLNLLRNDGEASTYKFTATSEELTLIPIGASQTPATVFHRQ